MWGEPREGTEAYSIKKEVEKRIKLAEEKKLDKLFSKAFHDNIYAYPSWIKNERNKRYVYPDITEAKEINNKDIKKVEFKIADNVYTIEVESRYGFSGDNYVDLTLNLNNKKVFGITEAESSDEWATTYYPISITSFVNEDWVEDFQAIIDHRDNINKIVELEYAESPTRVKQMKDDFGISQIDQTDRQIKAAPITQKWWFWLIIIGTFLWLLSL